ncbi:MAG: aminopeptidase P family protein [Bacteroidales bacterium]|nr:aminopeptidase P family protein [Bacteroidales bacterium]MCF8404380.1 aminopeptidase P family protein [Bacteroidales bacterium]
MFDAKVYTDRRNRLRGEVKNGIILILGNTEASFNYPANTYHFRQDSSFLYFFGMDHPDLAGVLDIDENKDYIFGNDVDIDDIIWMGPQPMMKDRAAEVGVSNTAPLKDLLDFVKAAKSKGRKIHFVTPYRGETYMQMEQLLGIPFAEIAGLASMELVKGIIKLRSVKDQFEIAEIEKAVDIAYEMHTTSMRMAMPGRIEREIAGTIEGISLAKGGPVSFPIILSVNGETLHNHYHGNVLEAGRMMVTDAGAETTMHYSSDITRTVPVGGKFNQRQKDIYEIVLAANLKTIEATRPGISNRELHLMAAHIIASGLKDLGLMKGNIDDAVKEGAHAMFFPHGLGHMMGLDVHDMEGLGENNVGYNEEIKRSTQFGTAFLRLGKKHQPGYVFTIEPGIYFIPALIKKWKAEKKFTDFINFEKAESYIGFGGIRIEDDILVTDTGYRVLGKPIPKTVKEIEDTMANPL